MQVSTERIAFNLVTCDLNGGLLYSRNKNLSITIMSAVSQKESIPFLFLFPVVYVVVEGKRINN